MNKGDKIKHNKYGEGTVLGRNGCREGEILVRFKILPFLKRNQEPLTNPEYEDLEIVDISDCEVVSFAKVKQTKTDWKENLGEGVLCHVWNDDQLNPHKNIMIVRSIHPETGMFNGGWSCIYYKYAEPIKYEDIKKYIKV